MALKTISSILAIAWASAGYAQTAPSDQSGAAASGTDIGEIVVTAQRRSERLVDVPISVSTASPADLERAGATSIENLTKVTPGIYLQRNVYGLSPTIRGIGSTLPASGGEQNVALYVDEIYYPTPTGNITDLASVAGVEVLKGPQGTLFGRNATGGAILLRTLDPGSQLSGKFNVSYERFDQIRSSAYVNVPLGETIAVNGAVAYRYSRGYVRDLRTGKYTNGGDNFTARGKIKLTPSDNFSLVLTASHAEFDDSSGSDTRALQPSLLISLLSRGVISKDRFVSTYNTNQFIRTSTNEFSARAKLDVGGGTLSSFTALLRNKLDALNELDLTYVNTSVDLGVRTKTFTQEVNYASSKDGPLEYIVGVYYFRNRAKVPYLRSGFLAPPSPVSNSQGDIDAIAGYADGTYKLGALSIIAGVRYSYEKRETRSAFGVSAPSPFTRVQKATDKQWTPRIGLRYELADKTNVYATYSKGFKSGVFDASTASGPGVKPETVDAFEVGLKTASRAISFNAAAYYYDYKNSQVNATVSGQGNQVFNQLFNVPKARIYGAEADVTAALGDHFDVRAAVAYTHSRYIDFKSAPAYINDPTNPATALPLPIGPGGSLVTVPGLLFANVSRSADGKQMVRSPEFTASGTFAFHTPIGDNKEFELSVSPYYSSRVYFTFINTLSQKHYATIDAAASLSFNDNLKVSVFGRNLTDSKHVIAASQNTLLLNAVRFAPPRVYGVSIGYSF